MVDTSKKQVLSKLADVTNERTQEMLNKEYGRIATVLLSSNDYEDIDNNLDMLESFVHRVSDSASGDIPAVISRLDDVILTIPSESFRDYFNELALQQKAVKLLSRVRYLEQETVTEVLLDLCLYRQDELRNTAKQALEDLSKFDLNVYTKIGVTPQIRLLTRIEQLSDDQVRQLGDVVLGILDDFLDSNISGTKWYYDKVQFANASIAASDDVQKLRQRTIALLKNIYFVDTSVQWKKQVLRGLEQGAVLRSTGETHEQTKEMIAGNAIEILEFYRSLVDTEALEVVQKIEHYGYWNFHHALDENVEMAALRLEAQLDKHGEYQIYRDLVGFEGIFGDWKTLKASDLSARFDEDDRSERVIARVAEVTQFNLPEWQNRIINYLQVRSDDLATFPSLFEFIEALCQRFPESMFQLLTDHKEVLNPALIVMMRGLWGSTVHGLLKETILNWAREGEQLYACAKLFISKDVDDREIFQSVYESAIKQGDEAALAIMFGALTRRSGDFSREDVNRYVMGILSTFIEHQSSPWVQEFWFLDTRKEFFDILDNDAISLILENLLHVDAVDYHHEEVLKLIADRNIDNVLSYFGDRIERDRQLRDISYEPVPFRFHKLGVVMAEHAERTIDAVKTWFIEDDYRFGYSGVRLLVNTFPEGSEELTNRLIEFVKGGRREDVQFVAEVLKGYQGQEFIYPIVVELVKVLSSDDELLTDIHIALDSTDVVVGEFGFANALEERMSRAEQFLNHDNQKVAEFFKNYVENTAERVRMEKERAYEQIELRKYTYGTDTTEGKE